MRAPPRTVLELVERLELPLSPRELLAIEELLGVELPEGEDPAEALAVGLASILATDRETWRQLRERVRAELSRGTRRAGGSAGGWGRCQSALGTGDR